MIHKSIIRKHVKRLRMELGEAKRAEFDARILARCQDELGWNDYERVMVFLPIERTGEINTWPLVRWIWANWPAIEVYAPRVSGEKMEAVQITPLTTFVENDFGIPEPASGEILAEQLDLILTPLLGFDAAGNRVGYGKGYFDRFFAGQPVAERVGLGYECLFIPGGIVAERHDVKLQMMLTEARSLNALRA